MKTHAYSDNFRIFQATGFQNIGKLNAISQVILIDGFSVKPPLCVTTVQPACLIDVYLHVKSFGGNESACLRQVLA